MNLTKGYSSLASFAAKRLEGKVAVITGGASGIGESTARLFARHGAKVVIADVQDDLGRALCEDVNHKDSLSYVHCDVTVDCDVQNAVDTAVSKYGKLDIMFSNAGTGQGTPNILETNYSDFKTTIDVNVFGSFLCAKHAARVMIPTKKGSILFTSSIASVLASTTPHVYTVSKHAIVGFAKNLCVEMGQHGIRVNCISPYGIFTPLFKQAIGVIDREKANEAIKLAAVLKGVTLEAEDVAEEAVYLGSDESKYVSGLNLIVDGGFSTTNLALVDALKLLSLSSS